MKRILVIMLAFCMFASVNAQETTSHWSVGLKAGVNHFYDKAPVGLNDFPFNFAGGVDVIYSANRYLGVGVEYLFLRRTRDVTNWSTGSDLTARNHEATFFISANLANAFAPNRIGKCWNLYLKGGTGVAFYKYNNYYLQSINAPKTTDSDKMLVFYTGLSSEWNITKSIAIFLEGQYRFYHRGGISGFNSSKAEAWTALGGLRFKFGPYKNNHVKNGIVPAAPVVVEIPKPEPKPEPAPAPKPEPKPEPAPAPKPEPKPEPKPVITVEEQKIIIDAFENLQFDTNKATIKATSYPSLDKLAELLKKYPNTTTTLSGYTDNTGNRAYNVDLSKRRANAVKDYLVNKGIAATRISADGFGPENPVAENTTAAGRAKNRRVEIDVKQ